MTATPTHDHYADTKGRERRSAWVVAPVQAAVIVAAFAGVGALAGWLWFHLWDVPEGVVSGGQWFTNEAGLRDDFSGVALYVMIAAPAGLVLGLLAAWLLDRSELVTLVAVVAGSVLAAYLMLRIGQHLSPPDPHVVAPTAADGTRLDGNLQVDAWPPKGAFTFGALVGLAIVYAASVTWTPAEVRPGDSGFPSGTHG